ncbi:MAG: hypothetical protein MUF10_17505 [Thermoanaerobaculaceae bacterium]|nr:hypothetical protein [Thermoanaerobaculaceae bacterium]
MRRRRLWLAPLGLAPFGLAPIPADATWKDRLGRFVPEAAQRHLRRARARLEGRLP